MFLIRYCIYTPLKQTNLAPENRPKRPKRRRSSSNHPTFQMLLRLQANVLNLSFVDEEWLAKLRIWIVFRRPETWEDATPKRCFSLTCSFFNGLLLDTIWRVAFPGFSWAMGSFPLFCDGVEGCSTCSIRHSTSTYRWSLLAALLQALLVL